MATVTYEFKDFSGGEFGNIEAWRAPKNSFTGTNMLVYRSGELGVRAGLRDVTPTGLTSSQILGMFDEGGRLAIAQATHMLSFQPWRAGNNLTTHAGAFTGSGPTGGFGVYPFGAFYYIAAGPQGIYKFDGSTVTQLNAVAAGSTIALYGDRLVIIQGSQVRYNGTTAGVSDLTSWPTANVIAVGDGASTIAGLFPLRGSLYIPKGEGTYALSGVPGVNDTLRRVLHWVPSTHQDGADGIWGLNGSRAPSFFNGTVNQLTQNVRIPASLDTLASTGPPVGTLFADGSEQGGQFFLVGGDPAAGSIPAQALIRMHNIWTKHQFGVHIDNTQNSNNARMISAGFYEYLKDPGVSPIDPVAVNNTVREGGLVHMVNLNNNTAVANFYTLPLDIDRPGFEVNTDFRFDKYTHERAGDNSTAQVTGNFTLPEQHTDDGSDIMVRGIIIDFRKWNTGGSLTNHFDLQVNVLRGYETVGGVTNSGVQSWDESGASSSTSGSLQRKYFSFGDQGRGGGFQLLFSNIRGLAFQRIVVIAETYPARI